MTAKTSKLQPRDENYAQKVRQSFAKQIAMKSIGIEIVDIEPGRIELGMAFAKDFTQQHGFIHGGIMTTALDSACGYAALSMLDSDATVLTVEFKTTFLAPAKGDRFVIKGNVVKSGRSLSFTEAQAWAIAGGTETLVASMSSTLMSVRDRPDVSE